MGLGVCSCKTAFSAALPTPLFVDVTYFFLPRDIAKTAVAVPVHAAAVNALLMTALTAVLPSGAHLAPCVRMRAR